MKKGSKKGNAVPTKEKALAIAGWLHEKKGENIVVLDVDGICPITEAMVVVSARNVRQAKALADHVMQMGGREGFVYLGTEGFKTGQWILLDMDDVLVHVFLEEYRGFYNIEGLWSEGKALPLPFDRDQGENRA